MGASWPIQYTEPDSGIVRECKLSEKQIRSAQLREAVLSSVEQAELEQMGRRMKFPAKSGNLATRWCSSILKIMVADSVIRNIAMDELKEIGDCRKFPAKGSISSGRYCSPNLKREVADTLIRSMDGLRADGEHMKFPAKSGCHQGRWCSGALKAQVEDKLYSHIEDTARDTCGVYIVGPVAGAGNISEHDPIGFQSSLQAAAAVRKTDRPAG